MSTRTSSFRNTIRRIRSTTSRVKNSTSSSSNNSSSNNSSSSSSSSRPVASRVPVGGGTREFSDGQGNFSSSNRPRRSSSSSRRSSSNSRRTSSSSSSSSSSGPMQAASSGTIEVQITDDRTGQTTRETFTSSGERTLSREQRLQRARSQQQPSVPRNQMGIPNLTTPREESLRERLTRETQADFNRSQRNQVNLVTVQRQQSLTPSFVNNNLNLRRTTPTLQNTPKPDNNFNNRRRENIRNLRDKAAQESNPIKRAGLNVRATGESTALFFGKQVSSTARTISQPFKDSKKLELSETPNQTPFIQRAFTQSPFKSTSELSDSIGNFGQNLQNADPMAVGTAAGVGLSIFGPQIAASGIRGGRVLTQTVGRPQRVSEQIFSNQALAGERFPSVSSTAELQRMLRESNFEVATASPQRLGRVNPQTGAPTSNPLTGRFVAGESRKSVTGFEDPGIFVAPTGQVNPQFLRIRDTPSTFTLNPFTAVRSFVDQTKVPTVTTFQTTGAAVVPPRRVLTSPGFEGVRRFQMEELAGTGRAQVTKRGLIGRGETPRVRGEAGTTEIEFVLPKGQQFIDRGSVAFTEFQGRRIPIRRAELINTRDLTPAQASRLARNEVRLARNEASLSRLASEGKARSPFPSLSTTLGRSQSSSSTPAVSSRLTIPTPSSMGISSSRSSPTPSTFPSSSGISSPSPSASSSTFSSPTSSPSPGGSSFTRGGSSFSGGTSMPPRTPTTIRNPSTPPTPKGFKLNLKNDPPKVQGYDVFVREQGKRIKVSQRPKPINQALRFGAQIVDSTVSGSFEIRKSSKVKSRDIPEGLVNKNKFRERKTKNALELVEKSRYRIDTPGEKTGLKTAQFLKRFRRL